jgi:hypothetical protein
MQFNAHVLVLQIIHQKQNGNHNMQKNKGKTIRLTRYEILKRKRDGGDI